MKNTPETPQPESTQSVDNPRTYNPAQDYVAGSNPNRVWSYGFGDCGSDFTLFTAHERIGPGEAWWDHTAYGGFYRQTDDQTIEMRPAPNKAVKIRFTAPAAGWYATRVTWTSLRFPQREATDEIKERVEIGAYSNSSPASESGEIRQHFAPLFTDFINGYERTASYENERIWLNAGESLSFEVDSGGDGHYFDDVQLDLVVREV